MLARDLIKILEKTPSAVVTLGKIYQGEDNEDNRKRYLNGIDPDIEREKEKHKSTAYIIYNSYSVETAHSIKGNYMDDNGNWQYGKIINLF